VTREGNGPAEAKSAEVEKVEQEFAEFWRRFSTFD
jgi:hypothetical protein